MIDPATHRGMLTVWRMGVDASLIPSGKGSRGKGVGVLGWRARGLVLSTRPFYDEAWSLVFFFAFAVGRTANTSDPRLRSHRLSEICLNDEVNNFSDGVNYWKQGR